MRELDEALAAFTDQQPERALGLLLAGWRATREPRLVVAIELLSERLVAGRPPPFDTEAKNPRQEWLKLASGRTDVTVPWLLSTVEHPRDDVTEQRLIELTKWPADPRIARMAFRVLVEISGKNGRRNGPRLLELLTAMGDPRFLEDLRPVARRQADLGRSIGPQVRATIAALERVVVRPVPAPQLAAIEKALGTVGGASRAGATDLDALLSAVYADPSSDAARLVLADALQEQGFPRGEFIALQVRRGAGDAPSAREAKLLKRWSSEWLAPYGPHLYTRLGEAPDFARGFLRAACFRADSEPPSLAWRTVEALEVQNADDEGAPPALLANPVFSSLREVRGVPLGWVSACLARGPCRWTRLDAHGARSTLVELSRHATDLPALERLRVYVEADELVASALVLLGRAWQHVKAVTVASEVDLSRSEATLTVSLSGAAQQRHLTDAQRVLTALPPGTVRRVVVETNGTLHPQGLFVGRAWLNLVPLAEAARDLGAGFFFRPLSMTRQPLGGDVDLGAQLLVKPPATLDEHVARLERLLSAGDFATALEALQALVEADPKGKTSKRVTKLLAQVPPPVDPDQLRALRILPLALQSWS